MLCDSENRMEQANENIDLDNREFQDIWRLIRHTNQPIFMTGRAGTGKSTFLKYITRNTKKKHVVLAPTGIAAVNAGGVTLHSFFKIPFKPLLPDDPEFKIDRLRKRMKYNKQHIKLIKELELIIIDEISMVRADILDFVDKVLRVYSGNMRSAFGGKQLLLVGDIFQLEPVVTADMRDILREYYPNSYFFSARVFSQLSLVQIELRKVYRQQDADFVTLLDRMRMGRPDKSDLRRLNERVNPDSESKGEDFVMTLATRRDMVDSINDSHLAELKSQSIIYIGKICDDFPESSLPSPKELELKVGAQVVFIRNDREKRWVNGTIGKVYCATADKLEVEFENGDRHVVEPEVWENIEYKYNEKTKSVDEKLLGTYTQYPVKLAWALTIHKSQGLTFNKLRIDVGPGAFSGGQTYVALSRSTSLEGITLVNPVSERDIFVSPAITEFSRQSNNRAQISTALEQAAANDYFADAAGYFDKGDYSRAVKAFAAGQKIRDELQREAVQRVIAQKMCRLGSLEGEIARLKEIIGEQNRRFDQLADEYVAMGKDCLDEIEDITAAIANFNKALSISPRHVKALESKARAQMKGNLYEEAKATYNELLEVDATNLKALLTIADIAIADDDNYAALDSLLIATKQYPTEARVYKRMAQIYEKIGDEAAAYYYRELEEKYRKKR